MKELLKAKSEFRKKGVVLTADRKKEGMGGSWKFAGEDNFIKTIQNPLSECGLELIVTMEVVKELNLNSIVATLYHIDSGESTSSQITLPPILPRNDKNGNPMYLDAEIERGKQFGYWSRILSIRILGLSDIDPEDTLNVPQDISDKGREEAITKLQTLLGKVNNKEEVTAWIHNRYQVSDNLKLTVVQMNEAIMLLTSKKNGNN